MKRKHRHSIEYRPNGIGETQMRTAALAMIFTAATATAAMAQTDRLTDVEYLQAARCAGLASSETLGEIDTAGVDALLKAEARGRSGFIVDKAEKARKDVERIADRAQAGRKAGLLAEREQSCQRYYG